MALNRLTHLSLACALLAFGCGDDDGSSDGDNPVVDSAPDDIDSSTAAPTQTGRIVLVAATFKGFEARGEGLLLNVDVKNIEDRVPFAFEDAPGSPFGCKVTEFTPEQFAETPVNFGTLAFTIENGPAFPPCNFVDSVGYACVGAAGAGGDITVVNSGSGIYEISNDAVTFGADQVGRTVKIAGATDPRFAAGLFPIVDNAGGGDHVLRFVGVPGITDDEPGTAATYQVLAGFGPALQTDPVPDDARAQLAVTAGGDGKFTDFDLDVEFGDAFTLDDATDAILSDVPLDGSAFSFSCDGTGGECNLAMANGALITTTDTPPPGGLPPFVLPPPTTKAVQVTCLQPGGGKINVSAGASAYLMNSGATRIRSTYVRANVLSETQAEATLDLGAGHAIAGFTQVPE